MEARKALSYYLTTNGVDFGRIFDSNLLPFTSPSDPRIFFVWLWEIMFNYENYGIEDINDIY